MGVKIMGKVSFLDIVLKGAKLYPEYMEMQLAGVIFETALYEVKATFKGKEYAVKMPTMGTSALMQEITSGAAHSSEVILSIKIVHSFIEKLHMEVFSNNAKPINPVPVKKPKLKSDLSKVKQVIPDVLDTDTIPPDLKSKFITVPVKPVAPAVMLLKDAEDIGQAVHGTDPSSIYFVIAANDRVKVAARKNGPNLSLRVEVKNPTPEEMAKVKGSGITWHGAYGSIHLAMGNVALPRIIGAFLYGMGIAFDRQVKIVEDVLP